MTIVSILRISIIQHVSSRIRFGNFMHAKEEAFQIAEAGLFEYRWYLAHEIDGKSIQEAKAFWQQVEEKPRGLGSDYEADYYEGGQDSLKIGSYSVSVSLDNPNNPSLITVESRGRSDKYPNNPRTVRAKLRRSSWSDYVVLTNEYSHFDSGWDITGKIMSNTGVHFDGVAHNVVYAGATQYLDPDTGTNKAGVWTKWADEYNALKASKVFLAGKRYPVVKKDFAGVSVDLSAMKTVASGAGTNRCNLDACYFENEGVGRQIIFKTDGKFDLYTINQIKNNSNSIKNKSYVNTFDIPADGVIYVNGNAWVQGTVNSNRVTVVAAIFPNSGTSANIFIGDQNLRYSNYDGSDVIGLIAQGDIEVSEDSLSDFRIDAAILAQNGRVWKKDYNPTCCGGGCVINKNSIIIFGSVISNKKIDFTLAKEGCPPKGFNNKDIIYDNNLLENPPPYFPSDSYYVFDLWEEL
ncbi:MAG TPA: hypothetical protein DIT25_02555 [Candidatus Moranbacteria bacterium]|nr:hypothetical protein [Candidatus Moranbacteria bacterium]